MKFRWFSTRNRVTAADVVAEVAKSSEPMMAAKDRLEARTGPVLQFWNSWDDNDLEAGFWDDVPHVVEVRDLVSGEVVEE